MSVSITPPMFIQYCLPSGSPAVGYKLFTYIANTSTKQATWTDSTQTVQSANPIIADANGVFIFWVDPTLSYKYVLAPANDTDPPSSPVYSVNNIQGNVTLATITQSLIGSVLYPQTPAEIAAGVTPVNFAYPEGNIIRYGVVLDNGVSDNTTAFQRACTYCATSGVPIIGAHGTIRVTGTVTINCSGDLSMLTVVAAGNAVNPVINVGLLTAGNTLELRGSLKLPMITNSTKPGTGWASQGVGIQLSNLYESEIYVPYVFGFSVNLDCGGYGEGFAYNIIRVGMLADAQINCRCQGKSVSATAGWCNSNTFIGGRFFMPSAEGTAVAGTRQIQFSPLNVATNDFTWPNCNTFIGPSVEGAVAQYMVEFAGNNNVVLNGRYENTPPTVLHTGHASATKTYENMIIGGYQASQIVHTLTGIVLGEGVLNPRGAYIGGDGTLVNLKNEGSSTDPLLLGYTAASGSFYGNPSTATNYSVKLSSFALQGKQAADAVGNPRVNVDLQNGTLLLTGAAPTGASGQLGLGGGGLAASATAGGSGALPAQVAGYIVANMSGVTVKIPCYNA